MLVQNICPHKFMHTIYFEWENNIMLTTCNWSNYSTYCEALHVFLCLIGHGYLLLMPSNHAIRIPIHIHTPSYTWSNITKYTEEVFKQGTRLDTLFNLWEYCWLPTNRGSRVTHPRSLKVNWMHYKVIWLLIIYYTERVLKRSFEGTRLDTLSSSVLDTNSTEQ